MTTLVWDKTGERSYQIGLDRGVLYLKDGRAVVWNGLTSVDESSSVEVKPFYLDGVKYLETVIPGDWEGKLKAFTYPDEFDEVMGIVEPASGLSLHDQPSKSFNLSYRTGVGNDLSQNQSYKIHLLYNLVANPDTHAFNTLSEKAEPVEFSWALSGTPQKAANYKPTVHISIDSEDTPANLLQTLERILYGTNESQPYFPSIDEIVALFGYFGALIIVDNGDGTWTAIDESNTYITMLNDTTFQIDNANVTYLDVTTYEISTTNP